jgi:ribosomal protein L11 methyltransferase
VGYFLPGRIPERARVEQVFGQLGVAGTAGMGPTRKLEMQLHRRPWRDWAGEARASFRPFQVTDELWVAPPWDLPREFSGDLLLLHPGAAFGLGSHPTTRGCLALIPGPPQDGAPCAALDIGTGTGILALRAAQCGYRPVIAFDNDPMAVEAAAANLSLNRMERDVQLFLGELAAVNGDERFGLILANVFLNPLLELAADLAHYLAGDGQLIVSGIQESDLAELADAFQAHGLEPRARRCDSQWAAVHFARPAP